METITIARTIECSNCNKKVDKYYTDTHFTDKVCYECVLSNNNNIFPLGKGVYLPCDKCAEPNIRWYMRRGFNCQTDCGNHTST